MKKLLPLLMLCLLVGCRSNDSKGGIYGGSGADRAMVAQALRDAHAHIVRVPGFEHCAPYDGWALRLDPQPSAGVVHGHHVYSMNPPRIASAYGHTHITYVQNHLRGNDAFHECLHILLNKSGFWDASQNHDRRIFPNGGGSH